MIHILVFLSISVIEFLPNVFSIGQVKNFKKTFYRYKKNVVVKKISFFMILVTDYSCMMLIIEMAIVLLIVDKLVY
jgi:hypothetical protein